MAKLLLRGIYKPKNFFLRKRKKRLKAKNKVVRPRHPTLHLKKIFFLFMRCKEHVAPAGVKPFKLFVISIFVFILINICLKLLLAFECPFQIKCFFYCISAVPFIRSENLCSNSNLH
uniref:Uncharacterized protein n=1 Tax=Micrurus surinamensis TaxID=129470 RepID=A0A2D4PIC8_MICSU